LSAAAVEVLQTTEPEAKALASRRAASAWRDGAIATIGQAAPPVRPARPARPELRRPGDMPRRRLGGTRGRIAMLHAVAHIELNAIDLAWDLIARCAPIALPRAFFDDWVGVADDEARHYLALADRLAALGAGYGDLPAHDGLWEAAEQTAHDPLARLAVVPPVLEARGLDVTPAMIERLERVGDGDSAKVLQMIYREEIGHVAAGMRWFRHLCDGDPRPPEEIWRTLVARHFTGQLKPPFNAKARNLAGFPAEFYDPGGFSH